MHLRPEKSENVSCAAIQADSRGSHSPVWQANLWPSRVDFPAFDAYVWRVTQLIVHSLSKPDNAGTLPHRLNAGNSP